MEGASELTGDSADRISVVAKVYCADERVLEAGGGVDGPECGFERVDDIAR